MSQEKELKKLKIYTIKTLKRIEKRLLEKVIRNEWLTVKDVEIEFNISRKTFDRMRENGLKVSQAKRNGKILIQRKELEQFLTLKNHNN